MIQTFKDLATYKMISQLRAVFFYTKQFFLHGVWRSVFVGLNI